MFKKIGGDRCWSACLGRASGVGRGSILWKNLNINRTYILVMFWRIDTGKCDTAMTIGNARAKVLESGSWGLNEMAVEAINGVILGLREGWCLEVDVVENDELIFLRAVDGFAAAMRTLGLYAEPGFFINRKKTSVRNIVEPGLPFTTQIRFKDWPVEFVHRAVVAISSSEEKASAMLDSYGIAVAGAGRFFDKRAWIMPNNAHEEMGKLARMLGVPKAVIDHRMKHFPQGVLMTLRNEHQLETVEKRPDWVSELFWTFDTEFEDPFNECTSSISRDYAIHAMTILEAGPTWVPDGWDNSNLSVQEGVL